MQLYRNDDIWLLFQHYIPAQAPSGLLEGDPPGLFTNGLIESMRDPVLSGMLPLVAISYSHAAWIEQFEARRRGRRIGKTLRVLKLLTFREPLGNTLALSRSVDLDVPKKVLDNAHQIFIEPSICSIIIVTDKGQLHKFEFS